MLFMGIIFFMVFVITVIIPVITIMDAVNTYQNPTETKNVDSYLYRTKSDKPEQIIVPDVVDPEESTRKSTQAEECKIYKNVKSRRNIIVENVGKQNKNYNQNSNDMKELTYSKYDYEDDPIQKEDGLLSKLFRNKNDDLN